MSYLNPSLLKHASDEETSVAMSRVLFAAHDRNP